MARNDKHTARRARGFACALAFVMAMALVPAAHAQWKVQDDKAIGVLGTQDDGTISKNTKDARDRLTIGTTNDKQPGTRMKDPTVALPTSTSATALDDGASCSNLNGTQQPICQQIVDLQNAQYKYMLLVYETSNDRNTVLTDLVKERQGLSESDYGKMEDNTNKLTALYNLIALDKQQMDSVNYAYQANIAYLNKKLALMAKAAQNGEPQSTSKLGTVTLPVVGGTVDLGSLLGSVVTGAVLKEALGAAQSSEPSGMQQLSIEKD